MTRKFDPIAWDNWRRDEFEKSCDNPDGWISVGSNLVESGALFASHWAASNRIMLRNVLKGGSATDKPRTPDEEEIVRFGVRTFSVQLMLFSFAIECLLKGLYIQKGGVLHKDGRYRSPKKLNKSHNLLEIAEVLGLDTLFSDEQKLILDELSASNERGRYPIHSAYHHYTFQPPEPHGSGRSYAFWNAHNSATVHEILSILYKALGVDIPASADALVEYGRVVDRSYNPV